MAIEDNNPIGEIDPSIVQTDMSVPAEPVDIQVEGQEIPVEQEPKEDFYRNLAEDMDDRMLGKIAYTLISDYKRDKESRQDWEQGYVSGLDLLGFRYRDQTRPFQGASGVTHPLLAEAVTQFQAQAYKELLPSSGPVRTQVIGEDTQEVENQAQRVEDFMNYMLMEKMEEYTPEFDQLLFYLPLPIDTPSNNHCGTCSSCMEVCPTQAIVAPYQVDARRCISYLTIELKDSIPLEFRSLIGNRVYGCDDCQLYCPWNKFAEISREPDFAIKNGLDDISLIDCFSWSENTFKTKLAGSAIYRIGYTQWLRNIAIGLGNADTTPEVITALQARANDDSALLREHITWALAQHQH